MPLLNDPDLAPVPSTSICGTIQVLFVSTGCDFVSFFKTLGKVTLLNNYYQYANFIGTLDKTEPSNINDGFLVFVQLVGTGYFKNI